MAGKEWFVEYTIDEKLGGFCSDDYELMKGFTEHLEKLSKTNKSIDWKLWVTR